MEVKSVLLTGAVATTSVYTFSNLITGGFVYVDKTAHLCELMRPKFAQYFCARPRRF